MIQSQTGGKRRQSYLGNRAPTCECGRPKSPTSNACSRCSFLDGRTEAAARVIGTMRVLGGVLTVPEIAEASGMTEGAVQRWFDRNRDRVVHVARGQWALREDFRPILAVL